MVLAVLLRGVAEMVVLISLAVWMALMVLLRGVAKVGALMNLAA